MLPEIPLPIDGSGCLVLVKCVISFSKLVFITLPQGEHSMLEWYGQKFPLENLFILLFFYPVFYFIVNAGENIYLASLVHSKFFIILNSCIANF